MFLTFSEALGGCYFLPHFTSKMPHLLSWDLFQPHFPIHRSSSSSTNLLIVSLTAYCAGFSGLLHGVLSLHHCVYWSPGPGHQVSFLKASCSWNLAWSLPLTLTRYTFSLLGTDLWEEHVAWPGFKFPPVCLPVGWTWVSHALRP